MKKIFFLAIIKDDIHRAGVGFCISNKTYRAVESFNPINERLAHIRISCKWFKMPIVVAYAPTEESEEDQKDEFYETLQTVIEKIPRHDIVIILGDMNAKVGREVDVFGPAIGVHSAHEECNDNSTRLASFANANRLVIGGTIFQHKAIHKETWNSPDGNTKNQIDHILISQRFRSVLADVRSYRGADCDSDHNMVGAKIKMKLKVTRNARNGRRLLFDTDKLMEDTVRREYQVELRNRFDILRLLSEDEVEDINETWGNIRSSVIDAAEESIGYRGIRIGDHWFDNECREAAKQRREARMLSLQNRGNVIYRENFVNNRRNASRVNRRKKRNALNKEIDEIDKSGREGRFKDSYRGIRKIKNGYQARSKIVRGTDGSVKIQEQQVLEIWKEFFYDLLNREERPDIIESAHIPEVDMHIEEPTIDCVRKAIKSLKNNKAPGLDNISAGLIKHGGEILEFQLFKLIIKIWRVEEIPNDWDTENIIPVHKKGDKTVCANYRGITLLPVCYKMLTIIIKEKLEIYIENGLGEYQSGFRKGRSTIDNIFTIR